MSFAARQLTLTFTLGQGTFGTTGKNSVKLSTLRASAKITKAGGPSMGTAVVDVYGMSLSQMNQLSTLGFMPTLIRRNTLMIAAGDVGDTPATVFIGTITNAWFDGTSGPDVLFRVEAHTGLIESVSMMPPSSYSGPATASVIMSSLATQMGLTFENGGVTAVLASPYFWGSPRQQAQACALAGNFEWVIDNGVLAIWPKGQSRNKQAPLIAPPALQGYPQFTSKGISVVTLFNPAVGYGAPINVQSQLPAACGTWVVYSLDHDLESRVPHGRWSSTIGAARPGLGPVIQ